MRDGGCIRITLFIVFAMMFVPQEDKMHSTGRTVLHDQAYKTFTCKEEQVSYKQKSPENYVDPC